MTERSDDGVHEPVDDPRWRESYYFSFYDPRLGIGGFSSIGKRPARSHSGSINVIWGPGIPTLVGAELGSFTGHDDKYDVAGLSYAAESPFGPWRLRFDGRLNDGGAGLECAPSAVTSASAAGTEKVPVSYELAFTPSAPHYTYRRRHEWTDLFTGHIDEVGTVEGSLVIDGRPLAVSGLGAKDHSWGVRDWQRPSAWRWVDLLSDGGPQLTVWRARFDGTGWVEDGATYDEGSAHGLVSYAEEVGETASGSRGKPMPSKVDITAGDGTGRRLRATGRVVRVVPISFSNRRTPGVSSWIDRALVDLTLDGGQRAWANIEFEERIGSAAE